MPLGTYSQLQAEKAAAAWQIGGSEQPGIEFLCAGCIGWHATVGGLESCGTWCYSGELAGRAMVQQSLVCGCPLAGTRNWN